MRQALTWQWHGAMPVLKEVAAPITTRPTSAGKMSHWSVQWHVLGLVGEITFPGATDALAFKTYVTQVLVPNLWSGACVVMDNLPAHKVNGIREAIESVGATVLYLSPYSPDFSPIENCWSKVKEFLRARAARTYAQLDQAITDALAAVTMQDIIGWFTHCCCYVSPNWELL